MTKNFLGFNINEVEEDENFLYNIVTGDDDSKVIIHKEFDPLDQSVNVLLYIDCCIRRICPEYWEY